MASNNYYQLYIDQVVQLAATMVIKSEDTAAAVNTWVQNYLGANVDQTDPTTWKYYMNLAGQYHSTDEMMQVVSMDTLQTIDFTVANLVYHRATFAGYQYGTRGYQELVLRYPLQKNLILGILNPTDINTAIAADDNTILNYLPGLVEANEYSLIGNLQQWINRFQLRWVNPAYKLIDNLYVPFTLGLMYMYLVPEIINLRLAACKTNEAHSFHVRQYLLSHGLIDVYIDQLTTKQSLELYRNIRYIQRNAGQTEVYQYLVSHIMTERTLPLASYVMRHNTANMPDNVYPDITFQRQPENLGFSFDYVNPIDLDTMLTKEDPLARDNPTVHLEQEPQILRDFQNSLSSQLSTKVLESKMIDYTDSTPHSLADILINHWPWLAYNGYYKAAISIINPVTGETIAMSVKDAYCFMWYAFCQTLKINLVTIPPMLVQRVQRIPMVTTDQMLSVVDKTRVGADIATAALAPQPAMIPIISIEAFWNKCQQIFNADQIQRAIISNQEHYLVRGYVENMVDQIYCDSLIYLADPAATYADFFSSREIHLDNWTIDNFNTVYTEIISQATGTNLVTTNSVADIQNAMIAILQQLSSYSVQFVAEINKSSIKPLNWAAIRLGDQTGQIANHDYILDRNASVIDSEGLYKMTWQKDVTSDVTVMSRASEQNTIHKFVVSDLIKQSPSANGYRQSLNVADIRVSTPDLPENTLGIIPVLGITEYLALTPEQQQQFKDIYGQDFNQTPVDPPAIPMT